MYNHVPCASPEGDCDLPSVEGKLPEAVVSDSGQTVLPCVGVCSGAARDGESSKCLSKVETLLVTLLMVRDAFVAELCIIPVSAIKSLTRSSIQTADIKTPS